MRLLSNVCRATSFYQMTLTLSLVLGTVFNPPVLEFAQLIVPYHSTASTARMSGDPHSKLRDKYLYQEHHEAIIDEQTFIAVAEEKKRRSNIESDENGIRRKKTRYVAKSNLSEQGGRL